MNSIKRVFRKNKVKILHFLKKIKLEIIKDAISESGIKIFPATMFDVKIKLSTATIALNNSCLLLDDGDVIGSGSITIEKKIMVGLRSATGRVFNEKPKVIEDKNI